MLCCITRLQHIITLTQSLSSLFSSVKILQYYNERQLAYSMAAQTDDYCNKTLPLSVSSCHTFSGPIFPYNSIWLVEIYVRGCIPKILLVKPHYGNGNKYCRRCEVYFFHDGIFCPCPCPCCGTALRMSPS
jgi:hypothetical protein